MSEHKKNALLVGATGLIGRELLSLLVQSSHYDKVVVMVRRPDAIVLDSPRIVCRTFEQGLPDGISLEDFYCTLGTTQKKSGKDGLRYVDKELVITCASLAQQAGAKRASIVSAVGVSPDSAFSYNRIKGEMEQGIEALGFEHTSFWQPSVLIGERDEYRLGEHIAAKLLSIPLFGDYQALPGARVARAMVEATPDSEPGIYRHRVPVIKQLSIKQSSTNSFSN